MKKEEIEKLIEKKVREMVPLYNPPIIVIQPPPPPSPIPYIPPVVPWYPYYPTYPIWTTGPYITV